MYEEYMQNVLGLRMNPYQNMYDNQFENQYSCGNCMMNPQMNMATQQAGDEIESCYPDIYRIVYPMVQKACMTNTSPVTKETIDRMTTEIYNNIETGDIINLNINLGNTVNGAQTENRENKEEKTENRVAPRNFMLNDLIRILLIRELLGRPGGMRPPFPPPRPPRPPMNRPPMPRYGEYQMFE